MASSRRNILIAHYRSDIVSGAENSIADLVSQIDPRFSITMLIPGDGNLARFYRSRGIQVWVHRVEGSRRLFPGLHEVQSILFSRALKQRNIDAVLCNTFPAASRTADACQMARIPYAIYLRDYTPDTSLHRKVLQKANALFAISKDVIHHHSSMVEYDRFRLAYNYINPNPILAIGKAQSNSGQRNLPFPREYPVVGLVGRITPYKQPDLFVRAAQHVAARIPDARFTVIGAAQEREKSYEESVRELASSLGIQEKIAFLGQRRDAVALTSEFSIACLTSGREPLGRVILEAHLLDIPVVVPDVGGPAEIVQNEITGLYFPSRAPDADVQLARQIIRLLQDAQLRSCLATKGKQHVLSTFASHHHVQVQEEIIDELCETFK